MVKSRTESGEGQGVDEHRVVSVQMPLPMLATLSGVREGFVALCVSAGREVPREMMEQDRTAICGEKGVPNRARQAGRCGSVGSEVTFGGRRLGIRRLRVRSVAGAEVEVEVPSFRWAADQDPCNVKRWRDGSMVVRWVGTALRDAQKHFYRLRGYKAMPQLVAALREHERVVKAARRKVDRRSKAA